MKEASDDLLIGEFTNGLKEEIKANVRMLGTQSFIGPNGIGPKGGGLKCNYKEAKRS